MELNSYFRGLLVNIEPGPEVVQTAKESHEELRNILEDDEQISQADPETYLSGSYARDTAIDDIKDVDIIMTINLDHSITSPDVVVAWLQASLQKYYSEVLPQGRSVRVTTDTGFHLDVVPADPISRRDGPIWIPDREAKEWVTSHPKGQITFASDRNKATAGYYKPVIKIMKFWRDRLSSSEARVKSYILESLVAGFLVTEPSSYAHAVVYVLQDIIQKYSAHLNSAMVPKIPDPGYPVTNVAKRWEFREFSAFLAAVKSSYKIAKAALDSANEDESIQLWRRLFGPKFMPKK
ncbi:MAG: hypothetical protein ACFFCW_07685 [Candidatus Hodarchaeota archaeon]